jgi:hypothetical protein
MFPKTDFPAANSPVRTGAPQCASPARESFASKPFEIVKACAGQSPYRLTIQYVQEYDHPYGV